MLKLEENPPILSPKAVSIEKLTGRWWVAHTKSRCEKAFAWELHDRGIGYFLPLIERVRISGGKKRKALHPLFSSYVFFCGEEEDRYAAMTTNRLCATIRVSNQEQLIEELSAIEEALGGDVQLDPYPYLATGQRCRIKAGPFRGMEGTVIRRNKVARFVLQVSILGQGAAMEVDADLLEPL